MSGPLPGILLPITLPLSWAYGGVIAARNRRFDQSVGITRFDVPVISVGNITTGGTGKTPMVGWIARTMESAGCTPVIAMRGYKARPGEMSDEEAEYRELLPDVAVLASPARVAALHKFLPAHPEVKCVILDDGFQHRQIHRDLNLVLIDAQANSFADRMLPAGNLREPLENLRRADAVVVTHADAANPKSEISNLKSQIERVHGRTPLAWSRHQWTHLSVFNHGPCQGPRDIAWLRDKRVVTMLGIARPQSVPQELQRQGAKVVADVRAADHERYDYAKLAAASRLCAGCDALVVTGKDWVKLRSLIDWSSWPVPIVVPRLEIDVFEGETALRERILALVTAPSAGKPAR